MLTGKLQPIDEGRQQHQQVHPSLMYAQSGQLQQLNFQDAHHSLQADSLLTDAVNDFLPHGRQQIDESCLQYLCYQLRTLSGHKDSF